MLITIRKSVKKDLSEKIPTIAVIAEEWMRSRYPDVNFGRVEYIFSSSYNRSRYFRNENNPSYYCPMVCISTRAILALYNKKSLGIKNTTIYVGSEVQMMCALIHELTHHVQYERKERIGNELDTTANELAYLRERYSEYYEEIVS